MSDSSLDPRTATAALDRSAPHPALRSLWALGGAPLAFVRADEQLAERLARLVRDEVPTVVKDDGRSIGVLTAAVDLARLTPRQAALDAPAEPVDTSHEPREAKSAKDPIRSDGSPLSRVLATLREQTHASPVSATSAASTPLRPTRLSPSQQASSPSHARTPSLKPISAGNRDHVRLSARWPNVGAVSIGRSSPNQSGVAAASHGKGQLHSPGNLIATALTTLPSSTQALVDAHVAAVRTSPPSDVVQDTAARLLQITERVERKLAVARASAESAAAGSANPRRSRSAADSSSLDERRGAPSPAPGSPEAAASRLASQPAAATAPVTRSAPAFTNAAEPVELRGFRGLARRALDESSPGGERAPMLQPLHHTRQGWADVDAAESWSLDTAARLEGLDLDEVAS